MSEGLQRNILLHLAKGLTKSLPLVGGVLEETIFDTMKDEQAAQEAEKLKTALASIQGQLHSQDTDMGDVLKRLEQQGIFTNETLASIQSLANFLNDDQNGLPAKLDEALERLVQRHIGAQATGMEDANQVQKQIEAAVTFAPASGPATAQSGLSVDRDAFLDALAQLADIDIDKIILRLPGARGHVAVRVPVEERVIQLVTWAESVGGPPGRLEAVDRVFHRLFPNVNVRVNPR